MRTGRTQNNRGKQTNILTPMSGFSYTGGPSRCSAYWQEFTKCSANAEFPQQCALQRDDYMECLHRKKEKARVLALQTEAAKQHARALHDHKQEREAQAEGVQTRVGLVPTPES
ncbi:hypothetical protein C8J57DRAFT_1285353 [Mycena rebaudengoi]|nr:hypothetical protein C8J57DRAFT_1285353 [Mycena rebaudengoi]